MNGYEHIYYNNSKENCVEYYLACFILLFGSKLDTLNMSIFRTMTSSLSRHSFLVRFFSSWQDGISTTTGVSTSPALLVREERAPQATIMAIRHEETEEVYITSFRTFSSVP